MKKLLFLPFATCAGIGDGHWRALVLLVFEFRELEAADSGRSKDEQRCKNEINEEKIVLFTIIVICQHKCFSHQNETETSAKWREKMCRNMLNDVKIKVQIRSAIKKKRNLQLAMEVDMRAKWLVIFAMCFRWWFRLDFEMCRQSERVADGHVHMLLILCEDGQYLKQLLELQAVATLRRHVTDSLLSRPRKLDCRRKKNMIHELEEVNKVLQFKNLSNW